MSETHRLCWNQYDKRIYLSLATSAWIAWRLPSLALYVSGSVYLQQQ